ncbi:OFA family MFS transporter [Haloarculaceae archaeon H-GB2-1]|nr:OFA family MFS transporter [Haloarculaceae archaeon H-GB1-1]MEA5386456.1 OFA family MFS transporter [Haloarculaceae archaeon H-GB11]MEA5407967.1 OFA family MFS transporter [Haloarculaceae archaeon H-GB2-1]
MLIHLSIGSVYAYSVYQNPIQQSQGWSIADVTAAFTVAIFTLGMASAFLGRYVERYGPRISGLAAAFTFGTGTILAGVAVENGSHVGFLLTYGVLAGIGLGLGYITPVSTLVSWFPDRRGLATGLAVMGFGAGALVTGPVANVLIGMVGIPSTFYVLGLGYFLSMAAGASYLQKPPEGWIPQGMDPDEFDEDARMGVVVKSDLEHLKASEAIRTPQFYLVWLIVFINVSAGIMLLSVASNMTQAVTGASAAVAATVVGLIGVFNGAGRIVWSSLSDYLGRTRTYAIFFVIQILSFLTLPSVTTVSLFAGITFLIITCYGGGFACLPAYLADLFGTEELGAIHGYTLTAWSLAGVAGPTLVSQIVEATGSYRLSFYVVSATLFVGLVCVGILRWRVGVVRNAQTQATPHSGVKH